AIGMLELGLGHPDEALRQLAACDAFLQEISISDPDLSPAPDIVDALARLGRVPEAREVARRYSAAAAAKGQPFALARAARAEALLAPDADFVARFESALRHHESTPDTFERARTQLYFGERLRRVRKRVEAREQLQAALMSHARPGSARKALMFTDLTSSTNLVEAIGDAAWHDLSAWLDGELRRCFKEHHGREVDHAGDGFFVIFDAAAEAIDCAITVQRRLANHRRVHGYAPQVRIGIHSGEVQV